MAIDTIWQGSDDDWGNALNWSGIEPINDDDVLIPATSSQGIQTGLANNAVDLDLLIVDEGYTEDIGSTGNYLDISADLVKFFGGGAFWYTDGAGTTDEMWIRAATPSVSVNLAGATTTDVYALRGTISITGTVTTLNVAHFGNINTDAIVTATAGAGTITTLNMTGGTVDCANIVTTANIDAGIFTKSGTTAVGTLTQTAGQTVWTSQGTVTTLVIKGGLVDFSRVMYDRTITDVWLYPGGTIKYDDTMTVITNMHNLGGRIMV